MATIAPISPLGHQVLQSVGEAPRFNAWTLDQVRPFLGTRILEAGCGIGNFTPYLLDSERLICADQDALYLSHLKQRFAPSPNLRFLQGDLGDSATYDALVDERLDTIFCVNVLEHIEADGRALAGFRRCLVPGGHAILLVPAHPWLYSACDRALGHHRRYTVRGLREIVAAAGLEVVHLQSFNRLGVAGWLVNKLLRRSTLSAGQMRRFESLLGLVKAVEGWPGLPGLSLIAAARKPLDGRAGEG